MSEYGKLLAYITVWDMIFGIVLGIIFAPGLFFPVPGLILNGLADNLANIYGHNVNRIVLAAFLWALVVLVSNQNYCIMYRFTVIQQDARYHDLLMSIPGIIGMQIIGESICAIIVIPTYITVIATEDRTYELLKFYPMESYIHLLPWAHIVVFDIFHPAAKYLTAFVSVMFVFSQGLSVACCIYIIRTLKKNASSFSANTYKMHLQLTRILLIQLFTPLFFVVVPICGFMFAAIFKTSVPTWTGEVNMMVVAIFPLITTGINIVCITPYWRFTKRWIRETLIALNIIKATEQISGAVLPLPSSTMSFTMR